MEEPPIERRVSKVEPGDLSTTEGIVSYVTRLTHEAHGELDEEAILAFKQSILANRLPSLDETDAMIDAAKRLGRSDALYDLSWTLNDRRES